MAEPDRPQSPFAGMADFSVRTPVRALSPDEIERMLAEHRLYLETEYHQGHRANFSSADLTGRDFSGLNLRAIKMDRAVLQGADFTGAHLQGTSHVRRLEENAAAAALSLSADTAEVLARVFAPGAAAGLRYPESHLARLVI